MKMKLVDYKIPAECSRVSIEAIGNQLLVIFEPEHYGDFLCDLTDQVEEVPRIGDTAVFWDDGDRKSAIIARLSDDNSSDLTDECPYQAANGVYYKNSIRFRSDDQYRQITGISYAKK